MASGIPARVSPRLRLSLLTATCVILLTGQTGCPCSLLELITGFSACTFIGCAGNPDGGGQPISPGLGAVVFEPNAGQAAADYQFLARAGGGHVFLSDAEVALSVDRSVVRIGYSGATARPVPEPEEPLSGRVNYLLGRDPAGWIRDLPTYARVRYRGVYPGIDVVYYGQDGVLEHDFVVGPGADPARIRMRLDTGERTAAPRLNEDGDLVLLADGREIVWRKPVLYQEVNGLRRRVEGRYRVEDTGIGFETGVYDPSRPLVIDPVISYSTYLGRGGNDTASRIAVDANSNVYVSGLTNSEQYPVTPGFPVGARGSAISGNVIVSKLNAAGTDLVWSTHIGGVNFDWSPALTVDPNGNVFITGATSSADFPVTEGVVQPLYNHIQQPNSPPPANQGDCFVAKLSQGGSGFVWSTYLGASGVDICSAIAVDTSGSPYVAGMTTSPLFPTTEGSLQRSYRGGRDTHNVFRLADGFVAKLKADATAIEWATYLGGTYEDAATAIALDKDRNVYVAGFTNSVFGFPVSAGAPQPRFAGSGGNVDLPLGDGFVVKINAAGTGLVWGTLIGGRRDDAVFGLAVDGQGAAYVTGSTMSQDFPVTAVARQASYRGEGGVVRLFSGDAFAAKVAPAGDKFEYVTYLGGTRDDRGIGIASAADGSVWITGNTLSNDFPTSGDAAQKQYAGDSEQEIQSMGDAFVLQLNPAGQVLTYSTYLGGSANDYGVGVAIGPAGSVYVSGGTSSIDFPTTPGAYQTVFGTASQQLRPFGDAFIAKIGDGPPPPPAEPDPAISRVGNAASYESGVLSPGEVVVIEGTRLGPAELAGAALATSSSGTQVLFDGVAAPLIYVSDKQTSAIVPYAVSRRTTTEVIVEYQGKRSAGVRVPVVATVPGLFSANASGRGQAAALNQDNSYNSAANPLGAGQIIVLFGTGEGLTDPDGVDGRIASDPLPKPRLPVGVVIGGLNAEVVYAGAAPGLVAGVIQVNARVPSGLAAGDRAVVLRVGQAASQSGLTIAVR
ncbi:MAG: SBBP repeat-containing protein [Bryobacteraceae bacterium]